jgi:excinuclease UvrABC ATPase subunit
VDGGNTVIVIEHNMDVVRRADWIIDLGPERGQQGRSGRLLWYADPTARRAALADQPLSAATAERLAACSDAGVMEL